MKKFKYRVYVNASIEELDRLGLYGWELISVIITGSGSSRTFYFKKELTT